jgi:hypothetical protein
VQALVTLFILTSGSDWNEFMYHGTDVTSVDSSMQRDASEYNSLFFVVFVCISSFFLLSLVT